MRRLRSPEAGVGAQLISPQFLLAPAIRWVHAAFAAALVVIGGTTASASELSGHPRVLDGGMLLFGDATVILKDIFAPLKEQSCSDRTGAAYPCGEIAAAALRDKIAGEAVRCEGTELDLYYNLYAICWKGNEDLNAWMVRHGWARAKQSSGYLPQEEQSRAEEAGLWGR
jgi:endonuclease YncB( thermonuclease family)